MDIRINSEYYYYKKNYGTLVMLTAAAIEMGWKSLICVKNRLFKSKLSTIKFEEAKLAVELVWARLKSEFSLTATQNNL